VLLGYLGDIAHADVWEDTQDVVVAIDQFAHDVDNLINDLETCLDDYVPLNNFRVRVQPWYVGVSWTFQPEDLWQ
jgi:hypothetical protein